MLDFSLGEFEALVAKAARGAGSPWGVAEEAGRAARTAAAAGEPAAEAFAAFLEMMDRNGPTDPCPLQLGLFAADLDEPASTVKDDHALIRAAAGGAFTKSAQTRIDIAPAPRAVLERLAARTYAPATAESRAKGAG